MKRSGSLLELIGTLDEENAARVRRVLEGGVKIPPQPRVIQELRKLVAQRRLDVRLLADTIQRDPGLAAMLFKVVGNAAYRAHQPFDSVERIIHAVGVDQTLNLALAVSLSSALSVRKEWQVYEAFWARSQAVGHLAMLIADERIAVCNVFPDQAYLAGIFHACGVPLLLQRFPTYCQEMRLGVPGHWTDWREEDRKFNTDHAVVGYLVARHWHLPEFICAAIRYQYAMAELGEHEARSLVAILALAQEIHARAQRQPNPEWPAARAAALPEIGLNDDALPEFVDVVLERYNSAA